MLSAVECQRRCANVEGCRHFTYWPDGGCTLVFARYALMMDEPKGCTIYRTYEEAVLQLTWEYSKKERGRGDLNMFGTGFWVTVESRESVYLEDRFFAPS